jgi:virulence factor Mce-like protein
MTPRLALGAALVAAAAAVLLVITRGNDDGYQVRIELDNAAGVRDRSPIRLRGVDEGEIRKLAITPDDHVVVTARLDADAAPIGKNATARVVMANLLGEKVISLDRGDVSAPQPSGSTIPASRTSASVDLDQVLDSLDSSTRTRLAILLREAGLSVQGRGTDIQRLIKTMPRSLDGQRQLLDEVTANTDTLEGLLVTTRRVVSRVNDERGSLGRLVTTARSAVRQPAQRAGGLRATIQRAPATLAQLRATLRRLDATGAALRPAAAGLRASAEPLRAALTDLPPFARDATPALAALRKAAPSLRSVGRDGTKALAELQPMARTLTDIFTTGDPVLRTSAKSWPDVLGFLEDWGFANQFGDSAGGFYTGSLGANADLGRALEKVINGTALTGGATTRHRKRSPAAERKQPATPAAAQPSTPSTALTPRPPSLEHSLGSIVDTVSGVIDKVLPPKHETGQPQRSLLDFLLKP